MKTAFFPRAFGLFAALVGTFCISLPALAVGVPDAGIRSSSTGAFIADAGAAARQPLLRVDGGREFSLNSLNDFLPGSRVNVGAQLSLAADALLTFRFLGRETVLDNAFQVGGETVFSNASVTGLPFDTYGEYQFRAGAGLLDFAFLIGGDPAQAVSNQDNRPGVLPSFATLAILPDHVFLMLEDYSALDADYDDMVILVSASALPPVPEPAGWAMMLGGVGIVGLMLGRRARNARSAV